MNTEAGLIKVLRPLGLQAIALLFVYLLAKGFAFSFDKISGTGALIIIIVIVITFGVIAAVAILRKNNKSENISEMLETQKDSHERADLTKYDYQTILGILERIKSRLDSTNYAPDMIIAFSRQGAVFAGMLCTYLKPAIKHMVVINHCQKEGDKEKSDSSIVYVPEYIALNAESLASKKILAFYFATFTGSTYRAAREFLGKNGLHGNVRHLTYKITGIAKERNRGLEFIEEDNALTDSLDRLPWIKGNFDQII